MIWLFEKSLDYNDMKISQWEENVFKTFQNVLNRLYFGCKKNYLYKVFFEHL